MNLRSRRGMAMVLGAANFKDLYAVNQICPHAAVRFDLSLKLLGRHRSTSCYRQFH